MDVHALRNHVARWLAGQRQELALLRSFTIRRGLCRWKVLANVRIRCTLCIKKRPCDTNGIAGAGSFVLGFTIRFLENYSSIGRIVLNLFHPSAALYASTLSAGTRRTQSISSPYQVADRGGVGAKHITSSNCRTVLVLPFN